MVALEMIPKMARAERFVSLAPKIFGGGGWCKDGLSRGSSVPLSAYRKCEEGRITEADLI